MWTGGAPGPHVAVLAHYDATGTVSAEVLGYIDALRDAGRSVFVASNAPLSPDARAALQSRCAGWLTRANAGHDFSAWRAAMLRFDVDAETLLLVNDSLHGPIAPLGPLFDRMSFERADIWALTDSRQRAPHLQSYFLFAGPVALAHPAWAAFWAGIRPVRSREWAIRAGELGFSRAMSAAGLRLAALWSIDTVLARHHAKTPVTEAEAAHADDIKRAEAAGHALNPSIHLWRALLNLGVPFAKRDLTGRNRGRIADAHEVSAALRSMRSDPLPPPADPDAG